MTASEEQLQQAVGFYRNILEQIVAMPEVQRNPDGDDQAAATMQLMAREALREGYTEGS